MIQYKNLITQYPPSETELNQLGNEGWDMCGVNGNTYHFKRETAQGDSTMMPTNRGIETNKNATKSSK